MYTHRKPHRRDLNPLSIQAVAAHGARTVHATHSCVSIVADGIPLLGRIESGHDMGAEACQVSCLLYKDNSKRVEV